VPKEVLRSINLTRGGNLSLPVPVRHDGDTDMLRSFGTSEARPTRSRPSPAADDSMSLADSEADGVKSKPIKTSGEPLVNLKLRLRERCFRCDSDPASDCLFTLPAVNVYYYSVVV